MIWLLLSYFVSVAAYWQAPHLIEIACFVKASLSGSPTPLNFC